MVEEIYVQLSKAFLEGFESKYMPRILEMCLSREEAKIFLSLPGTPEEVAAKLGKNVSRVAAILKEMFDKGFVLYRLVENKRRYGLVNDLLFDIFYDRRNFENLGEEWFDLWDRCYEEELIHFQWYGAPTGEPQVRIIPVEKTIPMKWGEVLPHEKASKILEDAKTIAVTDCVCRMVSRKCDNPINVCIALEQFADLLLERGCKNTRKISKEEALSIVKHCEDLGLVHQLSNTEPEGYQFLCNCCSCCCSILRGMKILGKKNATIKSRYVSSVNSELCDGCREHARPICVQRCQFGAIDMVESKAVVDEEKCFGCGLCASKCPTVAIQLIQVRGPEHIADNLIDFSPNLVDDLIIDDFKSNEKRS